MEEKIPLEEQETTINIFPARVSRKAEIYTCIPDMAKRLRSLASSRPDAVSIVSDTGASVIASIDRSCIKITPKRQVSDEQRRVMAERLAASREKRVSP